MYKKFLVIKLRHIGDVLLATPVFKTLKENFPQASISALVNKGTEDVLKNNPFIDEIITFDRNIKKLSPLKKGLEEFKFLQRIRIKKFDTTIDLTGGDRAAIISFFSGAKRRIGIKSKGFIGKSYLYTHLFEIDSTKHKVLQNIDLLAKAGLKTSKPKLILKVTENEKQWAEKLLLSCHSGVSSSHPDSSLSPSNVCQCHPERNEVYPHFKNQYKTVLIHPTSRWLFKCWKDEYVAEIIMWFMSQGYRVVLTSSSEEKEMKKIKSILSHVHSNLIHEPKSAFTESLVTPSENLICPSSQSDEIPPLINLAGKLNLRQLIAICSVCDIYFGVDTAPMHIAAALGKPTIALFGPSGAFHWGPWDNEADEEPYKSRNGIQRFGKNLVIQRNWQCIPCGQDGCKGSKISKCLYDIKPEEVIEFFPKINLF